MTTRRVNIAFDTALPAGTIGRFTLDKEPWIAVPRSKYRALLAIVDRMIGLNTRIRRDLVRWINQWPDDAARVASALEIVGAAEQLSSQIVREKMEVGTS